MKKKILITIILIIFLFSLTGCYDASTIEDAYYIVAMGIDLTQNESYKISIQIAKNDSQSSESKSQSSQSSSYTIYTVEADTIDSGISILNNYLNKKINLSHCSAIIFSEELAKKGIGSLINSLANNQEIRPNTYILVSNQKASDILEKVSNSGENFSSRFYEYIINSVNYTGYSVKTTFSDLLSEINDESGDAKALYTFVSEDNIQNIGLAIFKNDYMVGHTSAMDSIAHLLLTDDLEECEITINNPFDENSKIDLEIGIMKNSDIDVEIINNTSFITCDIFITAEIASSGKHFDYTSSENIETVERATEKYLKDIITDYLYTLSKEYNSDILNFKNMYSRKCLTNQDFEKVHFDDIYKDSYFDVNVQVDISSTHLFVKE